ncbi:MAG: MBL fold metallo-hydrolase [Candidatus Hydrogenedentota bacterium]
MRVRFWGVRGSIPTPGPNTIRYGGNTPCIEVRTNDSRLFILEAGTGLRELGNSLIKEKKNINAAILLSHTHWDHIHGFPFFIPIYIIGNKFDIYGPWSIDADLQSIVAGQMTFQYFPVKLEHVMATLEFHELKAGSYNIQDASVTVKYMNHPVPTIGYRIFVDDTVLVYSGDNESVQNIFKKDSDIETNEEDIIMKEAEQAVIEAHKEMVAFAKDADMLIYDAQYTKDEYQSKKGWGHSTFEDAIEIAREANVRRLVFFHHDPSRKDEELERILLKHKRELEKEKSPLLLLAAQEGMELEI